ncbi:helix-turn-helix domain-containing protein [Curtobacterium sp. MCBD17_023]|uniref:helix-turn-helix domain-containing protein n=1 Tax=Curtobacterium sp. MCBD17_023 TaxID=2175657 RepID=UPI000D880A1F|nr:helix-turn-helix domain-containing protein [Curtobacterium sp. MCBD17_023]PYY50321.1 DNA-binding protein [Curtobacterium sp. MCBD17_023]
MTPAKALATKEDLAADPTVRRDAVRVVGDAGDRVVTAALLELDDGTTLPVPPALTGALVTFLHAAADGAEVDIRTVTADLTTTGAAQLLGVSRPTLMKLVDRGDLPARKVGSHTRLRRDDVLALRERRRQARVAAAAELLAAGEAFD